MIQLTNALKHMAGTHNQKTHDPHKGSGNAAPAGEVSTLSQKDYITQLDSADVKALKSYTMSGYKTLNKSLRSGGDLSDEDKSLQDSLDKSLSNAPVVKQKKVYRALYMSPDEMGMAVGDIYQDDGYMSTTKNARVLYELQPPTRLTVKVPPGTQGLEAHRISPKKEEEILFGRGKRLSITNIKYNEEFKVYDVEAEMLND